MIFFDGGGNDQISTYWQSGRDGSDRRSGFRIVFGR
jgi:hypothetical protein